MKRSLLAALSSLLLLPLSSARATEIRDIVGATHSQGAYTFSSYYAGGNNDYLNEGAAELTRMGTRVIKVWFHPNAMCFYPYTRPASLYPFINLSDTDNRLVSLAMSTPYATLFSNPNFTTYVLEILPNNASDSPTTFQDGLTQAEADQETRAMKNLAVYLLQTYGSTGKTFVLQNWEGDNMLRGDCCGMTPPANMSVAAQGMRDWLNARQAGVSQARALYPGATAKVVHAAEMNSVWLATQGTETRTTMVNDVVPGTNCDLYSYSAWDLGFDASHLIPALNYIKTKAPDSAIYGKFNVYLGEYGAGENSDFGGDGTAQKEYIRRMTEEALGWGVRYLLYWQIFDNNPTGCQPTTTPAGSTLAGFWLVRPDGTKPPLYAYFQEILGYSINHVALQASSGYYVSPDEGGGYAIRAGAPLIRDWEYLTIVDRNGGSLLANDPVNVLTHSGFYFTAYNGGGGYMDATATHGLDWEDFTVLKTNGTGTINFGDTIALRATSGHYAYPTNGGGPGDVFFNADATAVGPFQTFTVTSMGW